MNLTLNDPLNLRDYILFCTDFIKNNGDSEAQPRTILSYLTPLFIGFKNTKRDYDLLLSSVQKLLSGNVHYTTGKITELSQEIVKGSYDTLIMRNLAQLVEAIKRTGKERMFYAQLLSMASLRFFDAGKRQFLSEKCETQDYVSIHLCMIKHGFETLFNVPCFFAERMYEDALTYDYDAPLRYALMKIAAESGNKNAALEYGNYIAKNGPYKEAFSYLLMAMPLPAAVWNLSFLIEKGWVGEEEEREFRAAIKIDDKLGIEFEPYRKELEGIIYTGKNTAAAASVVFCYKVYFYLAYRGFYKGFNSMAKLLSNGTISLNTDDPDTKRHSFELRDRYWQASIKGCVLPAISNEGNRLFREELVFEPTYDRETPKYVYMRELLELAASMELMHANYNLGEYYEYDAQHSEIPLKQQKEIQEIYRKAASLDLDGSGMNGLLYYRLGILSEDQNIRKEYFEQALQNGQTDAAYQLAIISYDRYMETSKPHLLVKAHDYLKNHIDFFSKAIRRPAEKLLEEISETLYR